MPTGLASVAGASTAAPLAAAAAAAVTLVVLVVVVAGTGCTPACYRAGSASRLVCVV